MDTFICGTCGRTFHDLSDFAQHKEAHKILSTSRSSDTSSEKLVTSNVTPGNLSAPSLCSGDNHPTVFQIQARSSQPISGVSTKKRTTSVTCSETKHNGSVKEIFPVAQPNPMKSTGSKGIKNVHELSSSTQPKISSDIECSKPLVSLKVGFNPPSLAYAEPQKDQSHQNVSGASLSLGSGNQENKVQELFPTSLESKSLPHQCDKSCIHIYESSNDDVPFGQLILEDNLRDVLCIEISSDGKVVESQLLSNSCGLNTIQVNSSNDDGLMQVKEPKKLNSGLNHHVDETNQYDEKLLKITPHLRSNVENNKPINSVVNDEPEGVIILEECVSDELENVESSIANNTHIVADCQSERSTVTKENIVVKYKIGNSAKEVPIENLKEIRLEDVAEGEESAVSVHTDCESALVSNEGLDPLNVGEVTDMTYASGPGLYTLILNADNSFTLIAGGCQGSANGQNSRIYVCHHCKKFASSQLEILNHISLNHPEDLADVNRCIAEFSSLTNLESDNAATDPSQVLLSSNSSSAVKLNSEDPGNKDFQEMEQNHSTQDEDCSLCTDEISRFAKDRQYDGPKCQVGVLKENSRPSELGEKCVLPDGNANAEEYCPYDESGDNFNSSFVNHCVAKLSSLTNSERDIPTTVSSQLLLTSSSASRSKLNSGGPDDECILELSENHPNQENLLTALDSKRVAKRRVGRPRKEDQVKEEEGSQRVNEVKSYTVDGDKFVCNNCQKSFPKHRQFDKHNCHMWKENLQASEIAEKWSLSDANGDKEEYFPYDKNDAHVNSSILEEDLGEEWKISKQHKPKVKIKRKDVVFKKRGRPPKVDAMAVKPWSFAITEDNMNDNREGTNSASCNSAEYRESKAHQSLGESMQVSGVHSRANPPVLNSIPTLPIFSNAQQQERLHKWITQIDLTFVDSIIDKLCPDEGNGGSQGGEMYICRECKVLFRSLMACRRHCAKHMARKAFTCPDCDFATTNVGALYSHYRNHTQNLYACTKCDFRARIKAHFRDHLETHNPNRYICQLCQRPYSTSNSLRSHIYLYHANEEGTKYLWCLRKKNQDRNSKSVFFQCPVCSKLFGERSAANRHLASHAPSVPEVFIRCEVCEAETLNPDTLKKHILKHKVVYICCICFKPQISASCLRNHLKIQCSSVQPESFRHSLLLSFTSPEMLPSLLSNKRTGPLLQENIKYYSEEKDSLDCRVSNSLLQQMKETGYKQIHQLLKDLRKEELEGKESGHCVSDVMKIVIDTRYGEENEKFVSWEQQQQKAGSIEHHHEEVIDQTQYHEIEMESQSSLYGEQAASCYRQENDQVVNDKHNKTDMSAMGVLTQDPTSYESDQRVVVISNNGEEQTVVVEDGPVMTLEEERFVIINDESGSKQPINFARLLDDND